VSDLCCQFFKKSESEFPEQILLELSNDMALATEVTLVSMGGNAPSSEQLSGLMA